MAFQIKRYYGAAQHQKQGGTETRKLPPLENDGLVGGTGPLGWVVGTGAKVAKGIFNFLKSTPNQAIRNTRRSSYTPAQKVEAMNLLKQLKKPVTTKSQPMMRKQKPGEEIYRGDGKWYRGDGSMGQNLNI